MRLTGSSHTVQNESESYTISTIRLHTSKVTYCFTVGVSMMHAEYEYYTINEFKPIFNWGTERHDLWEEQTVDDIYNECC